MSSQHWRVADQVPLLEGEVAIWIIKSPDARDLLILIYSIIHLLVLAHRNLILYFGL